jgi:Flp pilus assembly protein CpaB
VAGSTVSQVQGVDTSEVAIPRGDQAVAVTPATGSAALAGYLGPGDVVDVYATNKVAAVPAGIRPCATLVAADVPVLDVSVQTAEYKGHAGAARAVPGSVTVLLAASGAQSPSLVYAAQNEQIYLTEVPSGSGAAPGNQCAGGVS